MKIWNINKEDRIQLEVKPFRKKPRARKTEFPNFKFELVKYYTKLVDR